MADNSRGRHGGGNRDTGGGGNGKGNTKGPRPSYPPRRMNNSSRSKFQGNCDALKGHIFDCSGYGQADQFTKTLEMITNYVGREFSEGNTMSKAVGEMTPPVVAGNSSSPTRLWNRPV